MSLQLPEFVNLNGKKTRVSTLPPAIQKSLVKALTRDPQEIGGNLAGAIVSDKNSGKTISSKNPAVLKALFDIVNDITAEPRERVRAREALIASGIKGTSLHLGAPTPEVLNQLKKSSSQQNFSEKKQSIEDQISSLEKFGVVAGNSSTRPNLTKQVADRTFAIQQEFTKSKSNQVRDLLDSQEFIELKQKGSQGGTVNTTEELNKLLNSKGIAVPRFEQEIVNELAQQDIQGELQTALNIDRILERAGFGNQAVSVSNSGQLSGLENSEALFDFQNTVNEVIAGAPPSPVSDLRFTDLGTLADIEAQEEAQGSGILGILLNPIVIAGVAGVVGLALLAKGGKL